MRLAAKRLRVLGREVRAGVSDLELYRSRLWSVADWLELMARRNED